MTIRQIKKKIKKLKAENVNTELKIIDCVKVKHRLNTWALWRQERNNVSEYHFIDKNGKSDRLYYLAECEEDISGLASEGKLTVQIYKGTNIIKKFISGNGEKHKNFYNYVLNYTLLSHVKDSFTYYFLSFLLFIFNYGFDSITGKAVMIFLSVIAFGLTTFYFADKIYIYFNIKKQLEHIIDYNDTVSVNVDIEKIKTRNVSPLGKGRSNSLEEYLKICYIKSSNGKTEKYYHLMASVTTLTPQKSCECYLKIYRNTNIIKEFINW